MKKIIAPILLLLIVAVLAAIGYVAFSKFQKENSIQIVTGLIGSEKKPFFDDLEVQRILKETYQIEVSYETVGSRRIATNGGANGTVDKYDFAFPSGVPAATKIKNDFKVKKDYRVFFTPMTIASWQPVVEVLERNGIVSKRESYYGILDMQQLLDLMKNQTRWQDMPNNKGFDIGRQILIKSTDIRSSNSAAMYLSLASYLLNNDQIVSSPDQAVNMVPKVLPLFANQGFLAGSSATPFEDYLIKGMGNSPLVMMYESQYLFQASSPSGGLRPNMVLLYPEPTIFTQHTLMAMDDKGVTLGEALTTDEALQRLAIKHGFRSNNTALIQDFEKNLKENGLANIPSQLNEVIDPPSYDNLEKMITGIEHYLENPDAASVATSNTQPALPNNSNEQTKVPVTQPMVEVTQ